MRCLVESDFLLVESSKKKNNDNSKLIFKLKISKMVEILSLLDANRDLKQLIRSLQFLKSKSNIFVGIEDLSKAGLFERMLVQFGNSSLITVITTLSFIPKKSRESLFLLLGTTKIDPNKFFDKGFLLLNKVDSSTGKIAFGTYKIFNDLEDLKKIIFLSCMINICFNYGRL
jgi:hypothetical protein